MFNMNTMGEQTINLNNKSILYLFSPRKVNPIYNRPLTYNFGDGFIEFVADRILSGDTKLVSENSSFSNSAIIPSSKPIVADTSKFSYNWTFCLVVDNKSNNNLISLSNRQIYFGVCQDEPVNPNTINMTTPTLNVNCNLHILHKVVLQLVPELLPNGVSREVPKVMADMDVIKEPSNVYVSNTELYDLSPNNLKQDLIESTGEGTSVFAPNDPVLNKPVVRSITDFYNPKTHLNKLLSAVSIGVKDAMYEYRTEQAMFPNVNEHLLETSDFIKSCIDSNIINLNNVEYADNVGFDSTQIINLQAVVNIYDPEIVIVKVPTHEQIDVIPGDITSPTTVFSSLLTTTLPSILINSSLAGISFTYNSFTDFTNIYTLETLSPMTPEEQKARVDRFFFILKRDIFPILKDSAGEFELNALVNLSGDTYINLNFLDFTKIDGVVNVNNFVRSYNSPIIGPTDIAINNAVNLDRIINLVSVHEVAHPIEI